MPATAAHVTSAAEVEQRRAARRAAVEADDTLDPLAKHLLTHIHAHGDEVVDTMREGFGAMATSNDRMTSRLTAGLAVAGGAVLFVVVFLISGVFLLRGVDPKQAGDVARSAVEAVNAGEPVELPAADQPAPAPTNTGGADHDSDAPPVAPAGGI